MTTTPVYISRAFVEFGPFSVEEMKGFYSRGILQEIDHIRPDGSDQWFHLMDWVNSLPATEANAPKPAAKKTPSTTKKAAPAAKKAAAPAKKAAAKTPKPKA